MARIADYVLVSDGKVSMEIGGDIDKSFDFSLPANLHAGSRSILSFMLDTVSPKDLGFDVRINGSSVLTGKFSADVAHSVHEVVPKDLLKKGANKLDITVTGGKGKLQVGDIVLFHQVDI